jgi:hypothetical protein
MNSTDPLVIRCHALFKKLVPVEGASPTVEGEMVRAISRIGYRYSNDGDYFYTGYGCETAGSAHAYLVRESPLASHLHPILGDAVGKTDDAYEAVINKALGVIVAYVESRGENTTPNTTDMWDVDSLFEDEDEDFEDEDEDFDDEDEDFDDEDEDEDCG